MCQTMNAQEIAELCSSPKQDVLPESVRRYAKRIGVEPLWYCYGCQENHPREAFESPKHRYCNTHMERTAHKRKQRQRQHEKNHESFIAEVWADIRKCQELAMNWIATEEGHPNGYAGQFSESI